MATFKEDLYVGVDVGGTKILAALTTPRGGILARERAATPREGGPEDIAATIVQQVRDLLYKNDFSAKSLAGIGLAVPGVVGANQEEIVFSPNLNISGTNLVAPLKKEFHVPAVLGNDVNVGTLGEKWLGAARQARSAVGVFVGTGIGGGIIQNGRLLTGHNGTAGEIGHMVMQLGGPRCGCGAAGCLEALASRTAIERDLRAALAEGRKSILTELVGARPKVIKSSVLQEALHKKDPLVCEVLTRVAEVLGHACVNIRHFIDPEIVILGGGVMEACGFFILPIVQRIVAADTLLAKISKGKIVGSELGDDAVVLGAVALVQQAAGRNPFRLAPPPSAYPVISKVSPGRVTVGGRTFREDVVIRVSGKVKRRHKFLARIGEDGKRVSIAELQKVCKGGPDVLIISAGAEDKTLLAPAARDFLKKRNIKCELLPAGEVEKAYNQITARKAALIRVS